MAECYGKASMPLLNNKNSLEKKVNVLLVCSYHESLYGDDFMTQSTLNYSEINKLILQVMIKHQNQCQDRQGVEPRW